MLLKALYSIGIELIRKMLATRKNLCRLIQLTSCTILSKSQDACSPTKLIFCGTGILPVHKRLIENGAISQIQPTIILSRNCGRNKWLTSVERISRHPLTAPFKINFFAVLCQKIDIEAYPFLSGGGVSKHQ
ncbi:hypothetical protein [Microcoleus sp. LEGE 07076]|uniref:hypothetical protein n=1 Tax=Microcoleus sp. LEGE 07076 TaxID=915322 RepID=UPI00188000E8|nr:hypothetical protein [Microcoleus sp. LEGE 07076]